MRFIISRYKVLVVQLQEEGLNLQGKNWVHTNKHAWSFVKMKCGGRSKFSTFRPKFSQSIIILKMMALTAQYFFKNEFLGAEDGEQGRGFLLSTVFVIILHQRESLLNSRSTVQLFNCSTVQLLSF